jgi:L-threonylcarbamoyladenylate synthase
MITKILQAHQIDQAVALLNQAELVAIPTETVYGLAADASMDDAIKKVFVAKNRPITHPLILHLSSQDDIGSWVQSVSREAHKLMQAFWPGPLTLIFYKKQYVSDIITGQSQKIAIRVPAHPIAQQILRNLPSKAVVAPSANRHQKTSPTQASHVIKSLGGRIAAVVDGGPCQVGIESTIVDLTQNQPTILRYGMITADMIQEVLGQKVQTPTSHLEKVAGNMQRHYQPDKKLLILPTVRIMPYLHCSATKTAVVHFTPIDPAQEHIFYHIPCTPSLYAQKIYDVMHFFDATNVDTVIIEKPPHSAEWQGILDRLSKASYTGPD